MQIGCDGNRSVRLDFQHRTGMHSHRLGERHITLSQDDMHITTDWQIKVCRVYRSRGDRNTNCNGQFIQLCRTGHLIAYQICSRIIPLANKRFVIFQKEQRTGVSNKSRTCRHTTGSSCRYI